MSDNRYNGWTNYETWLANLWLTNDGSEWLDEMALECLTDADGDRDAAASALADIIEQQHDDYLAELTVGSGFFADLINAGLRSVDWREIAGNALIDIEYTPDADVEV